MLLHSEGVAYHLVDVLPHRLLQCHFFGTGEQIHCCPLSARRGLPPHILFQQHFQRAAARERLERPNWVKSWAWITETIRLSLNFSLPNRSRNAQTTNSLNDLVHLAALDIVREGISDDWFERRKCKPKEKEIWKGNMKWRNRWKELNNSFERENKIEATECFSGIE